MWLFRDRGFFVLFILGTTLYPPLKLFAQNLSRFPNPRFRVRSGKHPLDYQACLHTGAGSYFSAGAFSSHIAGTAWEQVPPLAVHQSQLLATASDL